MGTYTNVGQSEDVATRTDTAIAAGAGDHLPIGDYSGADYRSAMRYSQPPGWTAWTGITSATLKVFISDFQHVGPKNSSIFCSRMNVPVWTKSQGTQDCESGFSGANTSQAADIQSTGTDRISFSSGTTANASKTLDVTAMVRYYWANNSPLVFVFDNNGSGQYTELWSLGKAGTTYDAVLTINYTDAAPPLAPTQGAPAAGATGLVTKPTFSWTHNDPDAQSNASVRIWDAAGTTLLYTWNPPVGSSQSLVAPVDLVNGTTYQWDVATADAVSGYGPYSAKRTFAIKALPVVTISAIRKMVFSAGAPRLLVEWTTDQPQATFRVTATGGYDSGIKSGGDNSWVLDSPVPLALVSGTAVTVTIQVSNTDTPALNGSASRAFTPRFGLTTHKKTLAATPVNWEGATVVSTVPKDPVQGDAVLQIEYGQAAAAGDAVPLGGWFPSITSLPKPYTPYIHWRAWLIPNNVAGPTLDTLTLLYDTTVAALDKWGSNFFLPYESPGALPARFVIDTGEAVYGTRSLRCDPNGPTTHIIYSAKFRVRAGRSYTLSGLMRSQGNTGMYFQLQDQYGKVYTQSPSIVTPVVLTDWARYKTPVWVADADKDVLVACVTNGAVAGSTAWWDGLKAEESLIATPWNPAAVGATTLDAGGLQVDGSKGGIFRLRGTDGALRSVVEGGAQGLKVGGDTEVSSPATGVLRVYGDGSGDALQIGNDGQLVDVDLADTLGLQGQQNPQNAALVFGSLKDITLYRNSAGVLQTNAAFIAGGTIVGGDRLRLGGSSFPGGPATGDLYFRTDHMAWYTWNGSAWVDLVSLVSGNAPLVQTGQGTITITATTIGTLAVTFPRAFSGVPRIIASPSGNPSGSSNVIARAQSVTTSGFTLAIYATATTTTTCPVDWIAVGPR